MDHKIDLSGDFDFHLNEIIAPITKDKYDMDTNSASKFLFYHFNNLRRNLNEDACKIRHTFVSDDQYVLEFLQSRNWPYFIDSILEISEDDITSLNPSRVNDSRNNIEEIKIINDTITN